ncbi:MAG TPA: hypothetical protein VHR55_08725 [Candidatus Limnocylindria bacterium]|nr:hypothetical protein [Candidatus Limnocylindria bacterium]
MSSSRSLVTRLGRIGLACRAVLVAGLVSAIGTAASGGGDFPFRVL